MKTYNHVIGWKAWFITVPSQDEILRFSSKDICFRDLPDDGCLALVLFYSSTKPDGSPRRMLLNGYDTYFIAAGMHSDIYGCDIDQRERNTIDDIKRRYDHVSIKRGIWTDEITMDMVQAEMQEASFLDG